MMKSFAQNFLLIKKQIATHGGAFLLFDFDGVLSAIAPTPDEAFISKINIALLKRCADRFPTAIITGRTLEDIKKKVGLDGLLYIASHGLEWEEKGKYHTKPIPKKTIEAINSAKQKLKLLVGRYPGMIFENKVFMFGVHYRVMNPRLVNKFKKEVMEIFKPILKNNKLRLDHDKKTFELRPDVDWDKGDGALFAEEYFNKKAGKKLMPIYIGDSTTDEDAFRALNNGITIRVRPKKGSVARYYFKSRKEVDQFLKWLAENF